MSTRILTMRTGGEELRSRRRRAVVEGARGDDEEPHDAQDKPHDTEDQADDRKGAAAEGAAAGGDALPRDEAHDRRRRPQGDAEAADRAHNRENADHQCGYREAVGADARVPVSAARRHVAAGRRWRHVASTRRAVTPTHRRRWDIASTWRGGRHVAAPRCASGGPGGGVARDPESAPRRHVAAGRRWRHVASTRRAVTPTHRRRWDIASTWRGWRHVAARRGRRWHVTAARRRWR